ncbi:MAG: 5'-nucleotidase C-terminal domain-containing protein [Bacteroidetes bacterium]|nr:5'-nucleotidase C-terminal domain-containing protein [Bacteroidota bacterium]
MHRMVRSILVLLLGFCLGTTYAQTPEYLTILHLNDTHSNLAPGAPRDTEGNATVGGIARAGTIIMTEKLADPNAIVLHAGDAFIGDPVYNLSMATMLQPELQMLYTLGVDAMAVGNHEFDLGPDALLGCLATTFDEGGFPLLSANLDYSQDPEHGLQAFVLENTIIERGNLKIGIFGLTTPSVQRDGTAAPIIVSKQTETIAAQQVASLKAQGCDVIILLSHLGSYEDQLVAGNAPGINLIVGGHDHFRFEQPLEINAGSGPTYIVQCGAFYRSMGKTVLKIENGAVSLEDYTLIELDETVEELPSLKSTCADIYEQLDLATGGLLLQTIAVATGDMSEEIPDCSVAGYQDTHVGNLCADAYKWITQADVAFQPGGSTAQPIYGGPVLVLDLFRTIGYGFNVDNGLGFGLVTVDMTGEAIWAGLEATLMFIDENDEMLIHPSDGFQYSYNPLAMEGSRLKGVAINGAPIDPQETYTVAFNQLLLAYIDYLGQVFPEIAFTNLQEVESQMGEGPLTELEALVAYITNTSKPLGPDELPGRVTSIPVSVHPQGSLPSSPMLQQNYPNPFTSGTSIRVTLPSIMHATITVHDAMGREVAVLADRNFEAGTHSLLFHADGLPSGLYFCRLLADGRQSTIRLLHAR